MNDVIYVDEHDNEIGHGSIQKAVAEGIIRRVSVAILLNNNNEMLLQKRGENVAFPGLWNESTSGHVDVGETYEEAIRREMKEEMNIEEADIVHTDTLFDEGKGSAEFGIRRAFVALFIGSYNGTVVPNPEEVAAYQWVEIDTLRRWIEKNPEEFAPGALRTLPFFLKERCTI